MASLTAAELSARNASDAAARKLDEAKAEQKRAGSAPKKLARAEVRRCVQTVPAGPQTANARMTEKLIKLEVDPSRCLPALCGDDLSHRTRTLA